MKEVPFLRYAAEVICHIWPTVWGAVLHIFRMLNLLEPDKLKPGRRIKKTQNTDFLWKWLFLFKTFWATLVNSSVLEDKTGKAKAFTVVLPQPCTDCSAVVAYSMLLNSTFNLMQTTYLWHYRNIAIDFTLPPAGLLTAKQKSVEGLAFPSILNSAKAAAWPSIGWETFLSTEYSCIAPTTRFC